MFREMRRIKQQIPQQECIKILTEEKRGVFSVIGENGYPYAIPVNFYYDPSENKIYFHCAKEGHKLDAIRKCSKVCFTVFNQGFQKDDWSYWTTSVIVFGTAAEVQDTELKLRKCMELGRKYFPTEEELEAEINHSFNRVNMVCISIDHMTGKLVHEK